MSAGGLEDKNVRQKDKKSKKCSMKVLNTYTSDDVSLFIKSWEWGGGEGEGLVNPLIPFSLD